MQLFHFFSLFLSGMTSLRAITIPGAMIKKLLRSQNRLTIHKILIDYMPSK